MTVKELKAYLDKYPDGEEIRFIVADIKNRIGWPNYQIGIIGITDASAPVICLELHDSKPFDEAMIRAVEENEKKAEVWKNHFRERFDKVN